MGSDLEHYYAVIMAGGGGTRLWPLSRKARPKQMLRLMGESSLFQIAVRRLTGVFPPERIYVVTVEDQAAELQNQCPEIPRQNYLLEPMPRGTASVVGLAAVALQQRDPEAVMAILTADHFIANENGFRRLLVAGFEVAQEGYLVTLGISPTYPATGYGYIQRGDFLGTYQDMEVFHALRWAGIIPGTRGCSSGGWTGSWKNSNGRCPNSSPACSRSPPPGESRIYRL
jgi:mannose-1-phosphate guanylyltransferase